MRGENKKKETGLVDLLGLGLRLLIFLLLLLLTSSSLLGLIGNTVKVDEQDKVRRQESTAKESRGFSTSARTHVWKVGPVSCSKVSVGTEIDNDQINDELSDLQGGEVLLPPDLGASSSTEVVIVHQDMDSQVESDRNPRLNLSKKNQI